METTKIYRFLRALLHKYSSKVFVGAALACVDVERANLTQAKACAYKDLGNYATRQFFNKFNNIRLSLNLKPVIIKL
jgi:hypothetical protein